MVNGITKDTITGHMYEIESETSGKNDLIVLLRTKISACHLKTCTCARPKGEDYDLRLRIDEDWSNVSYVSGMPNDVALLREESDFVKELMDNSQCLSLEIDGKSVLDLVKVSKLLKNHRDYVENASTIDVYDMPGLSTNLSTVGSELERKLDGALTRLVTDVYNKYHSNANLGKSYTSDAPVSNNNDGYRNNPLSG
jgi:hypothetical protein